MELRRDFLKYVSLNVIGMIGISCYILADTFFVAKALGTTGLAALNFSISFFSVMQGCGLMIGIGGATDFSLRRQEADGKNGDIYINYGTSNKKGELEVLRLYTFKSF